MTLLDYATRGRWFTAGGDCLVTDGGREVATVTVEPGGFARGPTWTWSGAFGPEWELEAVRSDREYRVTRSDDVVLGTLERGFLTSAMTLIAADGESADVEARAMFSRDRTATLSQARSATVTRETAPFAFTSAEQWTLEVPEDVADPLRSLLLALPLVLDHQRRRDQKSG